MAKIELTYHRFLEENLNFLNVNDEFVLLSRVAELDMQSYFTMCHINRFIEVSTFPYHVL